MESKNFCNEKFLEEYNVFLRQLKTLFETDDDKSLVGNLIEECESDKISRGKQFYDSIEEEYLFELFCKSKVRLFSSKDDNTLVVSNSLFGDNLPLKKLINNQSTSTKEIIWKYLHLFYFLYESNNNNRTDRKTKISKLLKKSESVKSESVMSESVKNDLLNVNVNEDTNNMIDDIVKSFEGSLSGNGGNPFESIMKITQDITDKYNDKIESGEIELEKLMGSIQSSIPGMPNLAGGLSGLGGKKEPKEKVIIGEDFSTDNVELGEKDGDKKSSGMNLNNMLKMMNSMNGGASSGDSNNPDMGGLFSMLGKLESINNDEDAEKLKKEMDSYLENELGVDVSKLNTQLSDAEKNIKSDIYKGTEVEELNSESIDEAGQD